MSFLKLLKTIMAGDKLTRQQASLFIEEIVDAPPAQAGAALGYLRARGESSEEILGILDVLLERCSPRVIPGCMDVCGTGGDGLGLFNISTTSALLLSEMGVKIAKHGNGAVSSKSGSYDVLKALEVTVDSTDIESEIDAHNFVYLHAPLFHTTFKSIAPLRKELGVPTLFNFLGPLLNPVKLDYQLMGVSDPSVLKTLAYVLRDLGRKRALIVHGGAGEDELSLVTPSECYLIDNGRVSELRIDPRALGLPRCELSELKGAGPKENALITKEVLAGRPGPHQDIVALNAGAALFIAGKATSIKEGIHQVQSYLSQKAKSC